jgi:hypothetical protein
LLSVRPTKKTSTISLTIQAFVVYGHAAGETSTVASLMDALLLPLI